MRRIALLVTFCAFVASCTKTKTVKIPLSYTVETEHSATGIVEEAFVPRTGVYHLRLNVKFLSGNNTDSVTVKLGGLPATIKVAVDSFKKLPSYIADFVLVTNGAPLTVYPMTLTATAPGTKAQVYKFNIHTIPADCSAFLSGTYSGTNACTARNYAYSITVDPAGSANTIAIHNFGGYGSSTTAFATLNCDQDSLFIANQNIGNGTVLQGYGTFTGSGMTIWYSASNTPGGFPETCSATLTKQ
jgi:hypothetical protein